MVEVSDKWKEKFNETLVPESFVEITCGITEPGINKKATIITSSAAPFSTFHSRSPFLLLLFCPCAGSCLCGQLFDPVYIRLRSVGYPCCHISPLKKSVFPQHQ
jgi:hypothetical protein